MNRVLTSQYDSDFYFPLYQASYKVLQLLLVANSLSADLYIVLAPDCSPSHFRVTEKRKAMLVKFYIMLFNSGVDPDTFPDINSCEDLNVTDLALA